MLLDFARMQNFDVERLKKLEGVLAKAKNVGEGISEFKKLSEQSATISHQKHTKHLIVKATGNF